MQLCANNILFGNGIQQLNYDELGEIFIIGTTW